MLHHLLFYGCRYDSTNPDNAAAKYQKVALKVNFITNQENYLNFYLKGDSLLGDIRTGCDELFYVWALGSQALITPNDVGFSVGTDLDQLWTYYVIQ